jgi:hypothetical protein
MFIRSLLAALAMMVASSTLAHAQSCRPTGDVAVYFAPMRPVWHTSAGADLGELDQAVDALSRLPVHVSPMLGAVEIGASALRMQVEFRDRRTDAGPCSSLTSVEYSFGFRERRLVLSQPFGRDPCLSEFVVASFRKLADFEDGFALDAGEAIRAPVENALRTIAWTGEETAEQREAMIELVLENSVRFAFRTLNSMLRDYRAQYYETMRAALETVCDGRGATILALRSSKPA